MTKHIFPVKPLGRKRSVKAPVIH